MKYRSSAIAALAAAGLAVSAGATWAQQGLTITPAHGQSADQMAKDQSECSASASSSSGYNPSAPPQQATGGRARGAVKGAVVGGAAAEARGQRNGGEAYDRANSNAKEEYRQNNARQGAAIGAMAAGSRQRQENRANASAAQNYDNAFRSCMTGRGYTIK